MFCQNCGKKIEGGDLFCPFCGAKQQQVNPSENGGASFTAGSQKLTRKGLGIAVICVLIVIVLVLVLIGSLCTGGPKQVVKEYYQAIEKCDAKKLLDTVPKDYLKEVMDEKDLTKRDCSRKCRRIWTSTTAAMTTSKSALPIRKNWIGTIFPTILTLIWKKMQIWRSKRQCSLT